MLKYLNLHNINTTKFVNFREFSALYFDNIHMFAKFIEIFENCPMSSFLSKQIHTQWSIQIINNDVIICDVMSVLTNFGNDQLQKLILISNDFALIYHNLYCVVSFPTSDITHIETKLLQSYNFEIASAKMEHDDIKSNNMDFCVSDDDLVYSDFSMDD